MAEINRSGGQDDNRGIAGSGLTPDLLLKVAGFSAAPGAARSAERRKIHANILKRIDFSDAVTEKTQSRLERGYKKVITKLLKKGSSPDLSELEDAVGEMVCGADAEAGIPAKICGMKDHSGYMYSHSIRCGVIAGQVAASLSYSEDDARSFATAMILHDVGMLAIPEEILNKRTQTPQDLAELRKHPELGFELLKKIPDIDLLSSIVAYSHHAQADGKGYPAGIDMNELPAIARLAPVIDNFEALTAERARGDAASPHEAARELMDNAGRYHPAALDSFLRAVGVFPVNTFVKLNTGEVGVVVRNNQENLLLPTVKLLMDPVGKPYAREIIADMMNEDGREIASEV
ncbi:MAG: HD domain-containing phosphohydrolase [bacterium]